MVVPGRSPVGDIRGRRWRWPALRPRKQRTRLAPRRLPSRPPGRHAGSPPRWCQVVQSWLTPGGCRCARTGSGQTRGVRVRYRGDVARHRSRRFPFLSGVVMVMGGQGKLGPGLLRTGSRRLVPDCGWHWTSVRGIPSKALESQDSPSGACRHDTNESLVNRPALGPAKPALVAVTMRSRRHCPDD